MKIKISILMTVILSVIFSSCEEVFDYGEDGRVSYDYIFSDFNGTNNYLKKCYGKIPGFGRWGGGGNFLAVFTDEAQDANDVVNSAAFRYYNGEMTSATPLVGNMYGNMIEGIRLCNVYLTYARDDIYYPIEADRQRHKAEVFLLRAFYKWQLIKHYGPMPIINEVRPFNYDYSTDVRPSFYDCVKDILADCDTALANPELFWRAESDEYSGDMNKAFAYAIKSQAILFASSPQWDPEGEHKEEAAQVTKEALDQLVAHGYDLYEPAVSGYKNKGSQSAYQDLFLIAIDANATPDNNEFILARSHMNLWQNFGLPLNAAGGVVKCGISPSQELVDAYETTDGQPVLDLQNPYQDADHLIPNYNPANSLYDPANPFANRDPRLVSSIIYNGVNFDLTNNDTPVETFVGGNCGISEVSEQYTRTGYYLRKFAHWQSNKNQNKDGYWPLFRMAEIYLNFAEAELEAHGATAEAKSAVDRVRNRVGMPALPDGLSEDQFRLRLRNERRVEFAFEEHRYFDLRRWKVQSDVEGVVTGMEIEKEGDALTYNRKLIQRREVTGSQYALWPIPRTEQIKYENLGVDNWQNPGW